MEECIFCKIIKEEIPCYKVYEDNDFLVFLDIKPVNIGHSLVIPKKHYKNIFDLPEDLIAKYFVLVKKIASIIKKSINADGINIGMNNEIAAGQVVFHSHIHIIPRFDNDGLIHWGSKDIDNLKMKEVFNLIKDNL